MTRKKGAGEAGIGSRCSSCRCRYIEARVPSALTVPKAIDACLSGVPAFGMRASAKNRLLRASPEQDIADGSSLGLLLTQGKGCAMRRARYSEAIPIREG